MAMYGGPRDTSLKRRINRSFINRTVSEEVVYYKLSLADTVYDIYGDSKAKMYMNPILLTCIVDRQPQTNEDADYGVNTNRLVNFNILKDDLIDLVLVPEKGDIITWNESYYEVGNIVEDQLLVGKDPNYSLQSGLEKFGSSWSIICECHLTHINRLNLVESR
jgi:hypothetical protein